MGNNNVIIKQQKAIFNFILFRIVVVFVLIITITVIKFIFNAKFQEIKTIYNDNVAVNITADYFDNAGGEQ